MNNEIVMFTVYFNPSDYPGLYVLRRHVAVDGEARADPECVTGKTLDEVRRHIPPDRNRIARHPQDEPQIVESWF